MSTRTPFALVGVSLLLAACSDLTSAPRTSRAPASEVRLAVSEPSAARQPSAVAGCTGIQVRAGANLRAVVDRYGPGTTYCIHAGTYDVGSQSLILEDGDRLIGDPVRTAPAPEGGLGKVLTSVPTKIVGSSTTAVLLVKRGARVTFENLDVSGAAAPPPGANIGGLGIWLGASTVRRSRIHDNAGGGIGEAVRGFLVEDSELFRNGSASFEGKSSSGMKISNTMWLAIAGTVQRTYVHDNVGNGLWTDCGATSVTIQDNTVVRNSRRGIFVEISAGPIEVLRNTVTSNNSENQASGGGIGVTSSMNVRVQDNNLATNRRSSINVQQDARAGNSETAPCRHGWIPVDIVISGNRLGGGPIYGCSMTGVICTGNAP